MQAELFKQNAILVTNDEFQKTLYEDVFTANGYTTIVCGTITDAVKNTSQDISAIVIDCDNENYNTLCVAITKIRLKAPRLQIVGISIHQIKDQKLLNALDEFLLKPIHLSNLISALNKAQLPDNDN